MVHRVFVFGTLKQGFPNFAINRGSRIAGDFRTRERYPLYLMGERHTPWMLDQPGHGHQVLGQVFEVDDDTLAAMDLLERVHEADGYRRVSLTVEHTETADGSALQAFVYLKPSSQFSPDEVRAGPLADYTLSHASLYRSRTVAQP